MDKIADPEFVRSQYHTTGNLNARQALHDRFSASDLTWHDWTFSTLGVTPHCRVLDIGCGTGQLWSRRQRGKASNFALILADISAAMLSQARSTVEHARFVRATANDLPFRNNAFDKLVANHMLYHVPAVDAAVREFHRVLRPSGQLFVATNGRKHLHQLWAMLAEHGVHAPQPWHGLDFESGADLLSRYFLDMKTQRFEDHLVVTEVEPLVDYLKSLVMVSDRVVARLASRIEDRIDLDGALLLSKDTGILVASTPRR
ncbi:MAG: class I SAM-dependent methyltransferase [Planctomycetota bacterium]|jgi:ubiquinone/menaquinone biosynthesis C-methylase UbiE